ncbi:alpha/beta hydrolase fold domain-containing protein [Streptomyces sp. NPDC005813]|uniref:alpha/beta hydrolase fold domain-containing protein n=1 Tax=Streptomyces sp. NPDC005813 TaxID=3155592 RepID=UPI0033F78B72
MTVTGHRLPGAGFRSLYTPVPPVTDTGFEAGACHRLAEGYVLRRHAVQWWDQDTNGKTRRTQITADPQRAGQEQSTRLPPVPVVTAQADIARDWDEGTALRSEAARCGSAAHRAPIRQDHP